MQIEVSKNELAGALSVLGKLVCRTAPVELFRSLRIEGRENKISFQTVGLDEAITYTIPADGVESFCAVVNFDEFRTVVRYGSCKAVALVYEDERFGATIEKKGQNVSTAKMVTFGTSARRYEKKQG